LQAKQARATAWSIACVAAAGTCNHPFAATAAAAANLVAAEEERQTDTQTWAFRPRLFIQGPKCSRVVVVVAAAAAAQQQSLCSNWVALELLSFVGGCHHLFCLQKKREEHLCHCQKLAGELLLIILFVHLSETHTHTHTLSLSLSLSSGEAQPIGV